MTFNDARDAMLAVFHDVWSTTVVWDDLPVNVPDTETLWARVTVNHTDGGQATLTDDTGSQRYRFQGVLTVQIFAPVGDGLVKSYAAAQTVVNAYRDARKSVWFRDARIIEVPSQGAFSQINVLVNFTYDDMR